MSIWVDVCCLKNMSLENGVQVEILIKTRNAFCKNGWDFFFRLQALALCLHMVSYIWHVQIFYLQYMTYFLIRPYHTLHHTQTLIK